MLNFSSLELDQKYYSVMASTHFINITMPAEYAKRNVTLATYYLFKWLNKY